ncbi:unnamed protein product [Callosobruchus maculatus]|uniref:Beta-hexosaminidase n=2 Tax=Callosobruchus maculatus TaxID=64391 RepID=A0A653D2K9_CALMS|nr:unnamed protein product [Callosobruchus maculatus]
MVLLRCALLIVLIRAALSSKPGPQVLSTDGEVWPKPQKQEKFDQYYVVDAQLFEFQPDVRNCQILDKAFLRYQRIIQDDNQAVENHANSLNRVHYEATWIRDPFFVGYLKGLNVSLKGHCELYPSKEVDLLQKERYRIEINQTGAWLESNTVWGILRGLETFSQMVYLAQDEESLRMNLTSITDEARFSHRGLLIDTSRHFIPVKVLCTMLDAMAYNKLNVFHWHIVDDQSFPYVSKRFPKLSEKGAYSQNHIYSVSDVQYIIDYARDRGIRVIPEFDTPGHTRSWGLAYPELLTQCYTGTKKNGLLGPIDPTNQSSYTFLKELFKEIIEVFPDRYIHLGGDEVPFECWQSNPTIQEFMKEHKLVDYKALESYYVQHLLDMVTAMNSTPIVWEEVFNNGVNISKDTIVHVWYPSRWEKTLYNVTDAGQWALLSGCWYLDIVNSYGDGDWLKYYRCEPTNFNGTHQQAELILGGEACMWAEAVNQYNIIQRVWPRASAAAERLWSPADVRDEAEAKRRLEEHTCRMNRRGIHAQPPNGPGFCRH